MFNGKKLREIEKRISDLESKSTVYLCDPNFRETFYIPTKEVVQTLVNKFSIRYIRSKSPEIIFDDKGT